MRPGSSTRWKNGRRSLQPRNILGYLDIRLNGSGLIGGDKLAAQLEAAIGQTLIEDLPLKFAAVATEVRTGHEIWLTHGRMVDAMRASYALPGIFSPVLVGDRWLVDGALVNPVPVSAARALGRRDRDRRQSLQRRVYPQHHDLSHGASADARWPRCRRNSRTGCRRSAASRRLFSAERTREARIFRRRRAAWNLDRDGRCLQHHAGPHHPRAPCRRSAGSLISPRVGQIGWFDFHRAERPDRAWRARRRARHRIRFRRRSQMLAPGAAKPASHRKPDRRAAACAANQAQAVLM